MNEQLRERIKRANIRDIYRRKGYAFVDGIGRSNIFGVRAATGMTNRFDDIIGVAHHEYDDATHSLTTFDGREPTSLVVDLFEATTDPGLYYLEHPTNVDGTAILVPGQYVDSHRFGLHLGKYPALVQCAPMRFWRDRNRDAVLDTGGTTVDDVIGANIHKGTGASGRVDKCKGIHFTSKTLC